MVKIDREKQHIVPKVYLDNFADINGNIFKLRTDLPKKTTPVRTNSSKICYKINFYKFEEQIPSINGATLNPNVLEKSGFWYENNLNRLVEVLTTYGQILPVRVASEIAGMLFDLKIRNEYVRNTSLSTENINKTFDNVLHSNREQIESYLESKNIDFEFFIKAYELTRQQWLSDEVIRKDTANTILLIGKLNPSATKKLILNKLVRGNWTIIKPLVKNQFITSDNPGFCLDEASKIHNTRFGGSCKFYFPITPYHVLLISSERDTVEDLPNDIVVNHRFADVEEMKAINQATMCVANREIYAKSDSPLLQTWYTLHRPFVVT